ncbi:YceI family protein [uncultured Roseobacter sp.]|uniref:YceI family protein n=1 Tax=uncultured Roseobacter sp. TaxID=114847 RepID=UPI00263889C4|nr:YceI family protein [uncultured Roseobacter sp.]
MKIFAGFCSALALSATTALAGGHAGWVSVDDQSSVAFGSVKNSEFGEVHHFTDVSGKVSEAGDLEISINLASVQTNIDIRNERMNEHVFASGPVSAVISGQIDMQALSALGTGDIMLADVEAELSFAGTENDIEARMMVARLAEDRVLVTTADFIMLSTDDLGITAGIDKLMELASLDSITRVTPVSVRMVFEK